MAAPRAKTKSRTRDPRSTMTVASRGTNRAAGRRRAPAKKTVAKKTAAKKPTVNAALPGWSDLAAKQSGAVRRTERAARPSLVDGVPTLRFAVLLVAACALFTLYVGHIYATQALAAEVQQLQKENGRLVLKRNRLSGEFDRMTSPAVILDRAADLGLEPSSDYAPTIVLTD